MIYVPVPKEIKEYEKKVFQSMTLRQLICLVLGIVLGIGTYFLTKEFIGELRILLWQLQFRLF